jgi:hypothetical protein
MGTAYVTRFSDALLHGSTTNLVLARTIMVTFGVPEEHEEDLHYERKNAVEVYACILDRILPIDESSLHQRQKGNKGRLLSKSYEGIVQPRRWINNQAIRASSTGSLCAQVTILRHTGYLYLAQ